MDDTEKLKSLDFGVEIRNLDCLTQGEKFQPEVLEKLGSRNTMVLRIQPSRDEAHSCSHRSRRGGQAE